MLPIFNPENEALRNCPFLIIAEIGSEGTTHRYSNLAPMSVELIPVVAVTLFEGDTLSDDETAILSQIAGIVSQDANWKKDDTTGLPIDCHITFDYGPVKITVRFFAMPQLSMEFSPEEEPAT